MPARCCIDRSTARGSARSTATAEGNIVPRRGNTLYSQDPHENSGSPATDMVPPWPPSTHNRAASHL
eukprot:5666135-Pyramimonas_sp.AAC.1